MTKPDWAEQKVRKSSIVLNETQTYVYSSNSLVRQIAKLLRQERRRAVRACRKQPNIKYWDEQFITMPYVTKSYEMACDDCVKAIQGGGK